MALSLVPRLSRTRLNGSMHLRHTNYAGIIGKNIISEQCWHKGDWWLVVFWFLSIGYSKCSSSAILVYSCSVFLSAWELVKVTSKQKCFINLHCMNLSPFGCELSGHNEFNISSISLGHNS